MKSAFRPTASLLLAAHLLASPSVLAALDLKKKWYLSRAQSNMEIGNYKAAIEAYEKVVEEDPENSGVMRSLGTAYEKQGLKDKAIAQYDRYLELNPGDAEIAYRQAEALEWSRYSYRKKDALKYYQMGLRSKPDNRHRLKYARLLAANQETNPQAIEQYRAVLRSSPRNPEAHRGLAKAYAWNGQSDKAVYHSNLAKEYGTSRAELKKLDSDLEKGREPRVAGEFRFLTQPGAGYDLNGFQLGASGRRDLGAFVTARLNAGFENYWHAGNESGSGGYFSAGAQYRLDEQRSLDLALGYHSVVPVTGASSRGAGASAGGGARNLLFNASYRHEGEDGFAFTPAFERTLRRDSFLALVGSAYSGTGLGAARANQFSADLAWKKDGLEYGLKPFFGWVSALSISPNAYFGVDGNVSYELFKQGDVGLWLGDFMQVSHYGQDQSALSGPAAGGYFSPQFYLNQAPYARARVEFNDTQSAELRAGPSFQLVNDGSLSNQWQLGASIGAGMSTRFADRFSWQLGGSYSKVANKFNQVQIDNLLSYTL